MPRPPDPTDCSLGHAWAMTRCVRCGAEKNPTPPAGQPMTCARCDWADLATGDPLVDSMEMAFHLASHDDPAEVARRAADALRDLREYEAGD